jgi:hypothetical protein
MTDPGEAGGSLGPAPVEGRWRPRGGGLAGAAILASLLLAGCAGDPRPAGPLGPTGPTGATGPAWPSAWTTLGRAAAGPFTVELLTDLPLGTGLVPLAVAVLDGSGARVADAEVAISAALPAAGGARLAPALGLPGLGPDGLHRQLLAFGEPATAAQGWEVGVSVLRPPAPRSSASFPGLAAAERHLAARFGAGPIQYLLAVRFDAPLRAGLNPVTVSLHETADQGQGWVPVSDATFAVEPFMPSMGHGATGSVDPTAFGPPGQYRGALALSMDGDWEITFTTRRGGEELGRPVVAVFF